MFKSKCLHIIIKCNMKIVNYQLKRWIQHCNCQQKENCPMNCECLQESLVYYATISCNTKNYKPKLYKASCNTSFKRRYSNEKKLFNPPLYKHKTKLLME